MANIYKDIPRSKFSTTLTVRRKRLRKNQTPAEKDFFRRYSKTYREKIGAGKKIRRQQKIGWFIVDFYFREKGLIVELDGEQHKKNMVKEKTLNMYN